jgi:diacylglycerol kinase (ATP)
MCNYFSIGVEARVGLGFEKKRTSKVCCNKCVYFIEGIKKICCLKRTKKIRDVID